MSCRVLVVEDEIFVASEIEHVIAEMGYQPIGIAANRKSALALAHDCDVALVDLNLDDGPSGRVIGRDLAQNFGVTVLFMTANPSQLGDGVPGTLGVLPKPVGDRELKQAVEYAISQHYQESAAPPARLKLFDAGGSHPTPAPSGI